MVLTHSGQTHGAGSSTLTAVGSGTADGKGRAEPTHWQGSPFLLPVSVEGKQKILLFHPQTPESCSFPPPWGSSPWSIPVSAPPVPELPVPLQASQFPKASPALVPAEGLPAAHQSGSRPHRHLPGAALVRNGARAPPALLVPTALQQPRLVPAALGSGHSTGLKDHNPETPSGQLDRDKQLLLDCHILCQRRLAAFSVALPPRVGLGFPMHSQALCFLADVQALL